MAGVIELFNFEPEKPQSVLETALKTSNPQLEGGPAAHVVFLRLIFKKTEKPGLLFNL